MNNVEIVKNLYEAFERGDVPAVLAGLDTEIEWTDAEGFPTGGTYKGHDAVLSCVFMRLGSEWDGFRADTHELLDAGNRIVALGEYSGTYKGDRKKYARPVRPRLDVA
jgi:ketosteroid isomerase-like protein